MVGTATAEDISSDKENYIIWTSCIELPGDPYLVMQFLQ